MPFFKEGFSLDSIPLNLAYLAAVLKKHGHFVKGFNLQHDKLGVREIKQFDVFGISATSSMIEEAAKVAKRIKKAKKNSFIVLGGAHASALKEKILREYPSFDAVIYGEGEIPLLLLIEKLEANKSFEKVPNLIFRQGKKIRNSGRTYFLADLDELPFPDKEVFDVSHYPDPVQAFGDIIATRGCPFKCTNCKPGLDNISRFRLRKVEKVVDELEFLKKRYGVRHFSFSDSELAGPKKWVINFCREVIKRGLKITYSCNGRTDQVDKEVVDYLRKSGCVFIGYGIESGSQPVVSKILKKGIDLKQARKVIKMTMDNGIGVGTWFMIGIPGETWEDLLKTIEYAKDLDALTAEVNIATPWPDTGFYQIAKRKKWLLSEDWPSYNEKNAAVINSPYLSFSQVLEGFKLFNKEMMALGWKMEKGSNRLYHPHFLFKSLKLNLSQVVRRGFQSGDLKKLWRFLKVRLK